MKIPAPLLSIFASTLLLASACHRGADAMDRKQQDYNVVQEGSTSGSAPTALEGGTTQTTAAATPVTNGVDTTSNFDLTPASTTGTTASVDTSGFDPTSTAMRVDRPASRPRPVRPPAAEQSPTPTHTDTTILPPTTTSTAAPPESEEPEPPASDTTGTTSTTSTQE